MQRVDDKVNNTLNNPLDAEIVDTKVGYMFGNPISYVVDKQVEFKVKLKKEKVGFSNKRMGTLS